MNKSQSILLIPARAGSKRILNKNIKHFHGLPIIAYPIKMALRSNMFKHVFVTTDSLEIAKISMDFGATVPFIRDASLSDDFTNTIDVIQDALARIKLNYGTFKNVCCIYPTTPLLSSNSLALGLDLLNSTNFDYVFSAVETSIPVQRCFTLNSKERVMPFFDHFQFTRTQDLPKSYQDAGQFYWGKWISWEKGLPIFTSNSTIVNLPKDRVTDIDTMEDWIKAEKLYSRNPPLN
jgi:pseudaminic acid cytidylyltransferase